MAALETGDIQGIILSGYGHLPHSAYLFLHFDDPAEARRWTGEIAGVVTTSDWNTGPGGTLQKPERAFNVAFTAAGLARLGLAADTLGSFAQEFREGMAFADRPRRLGDVGGSAPERWGIGGPETPPGQAIHALVILQAGSRAALDAFCAEQRGALLARQIREVAPAEVACQAEDAKEHFGFRDGISQPAIAGSPNTSATTHGCIQPGEFILGYPNEYAVLPPTPFTTAAADRSNHLPSYPAQEPAGAGRKDLGRSGSYLVFRKLQQDVAGFRRYLRDQSHGDPEEAVRLAAKMVGRWPSGAPLVLAPERDAPELGEPPLNNAFAYAEQDADGYRCPVGAHIRRTNPRDLLAGDVTEATRSVSRHRLLRRGVRYGEPLPAGTYEDDGKARGILFLCINTDIKRQFEFVQQTWANNPRFGGLYSDSDPLIGTNADPQRPDDTGPWTMTIPGQPVRRRLNGLPRFVQVKGGAYFFLPGIRALRFLGSLATDPTPEEGG